MKRISLVVVAAAAAVVACSSALAGSPPVRIAFIKGTATTEPSVWVANGSGGGQHKLGAGEQPLISPNGALVAAEEFTKGPQLRVYRVSGGHRNLFNTGKYTVAVLAWSPNSRDLAVAVTSDSTNAAGSYLAVVNTSSWKVTKVANGYVSGASFSPSGTEIVYSKWRIAYTFNANLYTVKVNGSGRKQITFNDGSLDPVWGRKGIVFSREACRPSGATTCRGSIRYFMGQPYGPAGQLWLRSGLHETQLTHVSVGLLVYGLTPVGVSSSGNRILAAFTGEDTDYAVAVQISPRVVHTVDVGEQYAVPAGISKNGNTLLIAYGSFEQPANQGTVDTVPFLGSHRDALMHGASPSWNK
jgi:hypothetical protein